MGRITVLSILVCGAAASIRSEGYGGPHSTRLNPLMDLVDEHYEHTIVVADSLGDADRLMLGLENGWKHLLNSEMGGSFPQECLKTGFGPLAAPQKVLLIQMGHSGDFNEPAVYEILGRVHECLGWDVRGLATLSNFQKHVADEQGRLAADTRQEDPRFPFALSGKAWDRIASKYAPIVRVKRSVFLSDTLGNRNFDSVKWNSVELKKALQDHRFDLIRDQVMDFVRKFSIGDAPTFSQKLTEGSEHDVCTNMLPRILISLNADRVFISGKEETRVRCEGRLFIVGNEGYHSIGVQPGGWASWNTNVDDSAPKALPPILPSVEFEWSQFKYLIVIPDLHGDFENGVASICRGIQKSVKSDAFNCNFFAKHVDVAMDKLANGEVVSPIIEDAGSVLMIQLGDIVDRGPDSKKLYFLFDQMEAIVGIKCVSIMGNHEHMQHSNPVGYSKYVHKDEDGLYGGKEERISEFINGLTWDRIFSKYSMFVKVGKVLFVHGGVDLDWFKLLGMKADKLHVDEVNLAVRENLDNIEIMQPDNESCPFWTRALSYKDERWKNPPNGWTDPLSIEDSLERSARKILPKPLLCDEYLDPILAAFNVERIIVGHTPQADGVAKSRCGGKVLLADVGISRWIYSTDPDPSREPMALVIDTGANSYIAHYAKKPSGILIPSIEKPINAH